MSTLFAEARELHIQQFDAFVRKSRDECRQGSPEVKLELNAGSRCLERFYCADYICSDEGRQVLEMMPSETLAVSGQSIRVAGMDVDLDALVWDDMAIAFDGGRLDEDALMPWFLRWCDPDEVRPPAEGPFSLSAHAVILEPGELWVDLGTAPGDAAHELFEVLRGAGCTRMRISASRSD